MPRFSVFAFGVDPKTSTPDFHETGQFCQEREAIGLLVRVARRSYQWAKPTAREVIAKRQAQFKPFIPQNLPPTEAGGSTAKVPGTHSQRLGRRVLLRIARQMCQQKVSAQ